MSGGRLPVLAFVLMPLLGGCVQLFSSSEASVGAHAVFLARPECPTFVARTLDVGFTVATVRGSDYRPTTGDVFEGPNRLGQSVYRMFPPEDSATRLGGRNVPLQIEALDLPLGEARARLDAACGAPR